MDGYDYAVTAAWAASFCLGCDGYLGEGGREYCSQTCLLRDEENARRPQTRSPEAIHLALMLNRRQLPFCRLTGGLAADNLSALTQTLSLADVYGNDGQHDRRETHTPRGRSKRAKSRNSSTNNGSKMMSRPASLPSRFKTRKTRTGTATESSPEEGLAEWNTWRPRSTSPALGSDDVGSVDVGSDNVTASEKTSDEEHAPWELVAYWDANSMDQG
ncbi:hypothetical protein AAL_02200 [Moelleriella libera RCEF 2490]|uniref:Life-span regulatory factor n=1 Tax=Moelleriella libera RCEF 2490 TaxID=1081109 RepID=A0A168F9K1_9HYPO|nr:hypothetical protein AAL_02200 [Moelleriella libera RCEF 2490]